MFNATKFNRKRHSDHRCLINTCLVFLFGYTATLIVAWVFFQRANAPSSEWQNIVLTSLVWLFVSEFACILCAVIFMRIYSLKITVVNDEMFYVVPTGAHEERINEERWTISEVEDPKPLAPLRSRAKPVRQQMPASITKQQQQEDDEDSKLRERADASVAVGSPQYDDDEEAEASEADNESAPVESKRKDESAAIDGIHSVLGDEDTV